MTGTTANTNCKYIELKRVDPDSRKSKEQTALSWMPSLKMDRVKSIVSRQNNVK